MERPHLSKNKNAIAQRAGRHIARPQTKTEAIARSSLHPLEEMQALYGNRAVNQLLASQPTLEAKPMFRGLSGELQNSPMQGKGGQQPTVLQAKLEIGAPGDKYEQEADRVAKEVVSRMNAPVSSTVQREEISELEEEELQKKQIVQRVLDVGGMAASPELEASIQEAKVSGQPLSESVREPYEREFGADFTGVRVHTDTKSDELNRSIQAMAFTTGMDVFFSKGAYEPSSVVGKVLLAHELTHVKQQNTENGKIKSSGNIRLLQRTRLRSDRPAPPPPFGLTPQLQEIYTKNQGDPKITGLVNYIHLNWQRYKSGEYTKAYKSLLYSEDRNPCREKLTVRRTPAHVSYSSPTLSKEVAKKCKHDKLTDTVVLGELKKIPYGNIDNLAPAGSISSSAMPRTTIPAISIRTSGRSPW